MSPGRVKLGSVARATLAARPTLVSSMPPHHTGTPRSAHRSWIFWAAVSPPTRPTLMLMIRQASMSSAQRACSGEWMLSSRHKGVRSCFCSWAWSTMSSW